MVANYLDKVKKSPSFRKVIGIGIILFMMIGSTLWDFYKGENVYNDSLKVLLPSARVKILTVPKRDYTKEVDDVELKNYIFNCLRDAKESGFGRRSAEVYDIFISVNEYKYKYWLSYDVGNRKLNFWPSVINADGSKTSGNNYLSSCRLDEFNKKLGLESINSQ